MTSKLEQQREVLGRIRRTQITGVSAEFAVTPGEALAGYYLKREKKLKAKIAKKKKAKGKRRSVLCVSGCFEQGKRR